MKAIKQPPEIIRDPIKEVIEQDFDLLDQYLSYHAPVDERGRYLHFDELFRRLPKNLKPKLAWSIVKSARNRQSVNVLAYSDPVDYEGGEIFEELSRYTFTPTLQKVTSEVDRYTNSAVLEAMLTQVNEREKLEYLFNDLIDEEAISSSQLEGAATTTKIAKDMLKKKREPRSLDERMILGNFKMMKYVWQNRNKDLTVEFLEDLHRIGVEGIDDEEYNPGVVRVTNDVVVEDGDGETVHTPPEANHLPKRLQRLCEWANEAHHNTDCQNYLHPLLKAITLHFFIGYEHPFHDGNGRVARAIFYWYMFKNDYSAFRYIAISTLLKAAPVQYGRSYLFTETDQMDLTYFLEYQCKIIARAISEFRACHEQAVKSIEEFDMFLVKSGLYGKMNHRQRVLLQVAKNGVESEFTINAVKENLECSYNTAASALNGLVKLELFSKEKKGKEWEYKLKGKDAIIGAWKKIK